jgi:purine nucleosidase
MLLSVSAVYAQKMPIILDTDIGTDIDDAFALALALASPEIELRGVTTVSADAYGRALIACRMLHYAGHGDVAVAPGRPQRQQPEQKGQYQYGLEGGFPNRPLPELPPEFMYKKLQAEPGRVTLVTIGDLTNDDGEAGAADARTQDSADRSSPRALQALGKGPADTVRSRRRDA